MDRWRWSSGFAFHRSGSTIEENDILRQSGIRLYDGPNRTAFSDGIIQLTTHRLLWSDQNLSDGFYVTLPLAAISSVQLEENSSLLTNRTPKIVLRLYSLTTLRNKLNSLTDRSQWMNDWCDIAGSKAVVVNHSNEDHAKLGFTKGGHREFETALLGALQVKVWELSSLASNSSHRFGGGIGAIQKKQAARAAAADVTITEAFQDLNKLMLHATEMVKLSRNLATKLRDSKENNLSVNEIAELRSTMLSMGVVDQLDNNLSEEQPNFSFHKNLAHQLSKLICPLLFQSDDKSSSGHIGITGCMDLASAYCRINRARGMDLVSPNDLLRACQLLESEQLPLRLKSYSGGLYVLQLASENEQDTLLATAEQVEKHTCLTAGELARILNLTTFLAKARLLAVEEAGLICRDDSEAGLKFYPNYFLTRANLI